MEILVIFFTVYAILFVGELGDKTQLIVFNLALENKKSYKVGLGASLGFAVIVTIGIIFGTIITNLIPLSLISIISGLVFIVIGLLELRPLKKLYLERKKSNENTDNDKSDMKENEIGTRFAKMRKNPYIAGFLFIFIMELGDKTQILTITLATIYPYPLIVWLGSFLALTSLAWIGVGFGAIISRKVPKFYLKIVSIIIFITIGLVIIITELL
ncbi:MAG: TMEM165/GDT1 family protein [Candidatus Hodarchaeota archaeon]